MTKLKHSFMAIFGLFMVLVGVAADLGEILTLENGLWLLMALFILTVGYTASEQVLRFWRNYRTSQIKLHEIRELIQGQGRSDVIRHCTQALRIFQLQGQLIRITSIQSPEIVVVDVSTVDLHGPNDLVGMNFTITSLNGGGQSQGRVTLCNGTQAHIQLHQPTTTIEVGDLATPIKPSQATELESLCAEVLLIIG